VSHLIPPYAEKALGHLIVACAVVLIVLYAVLACVVVAGFLADYNEMPWASLIFAVIFAMFFVGGACAAAMLGAEWLKEQREKAERLAA
jgi:hypothetical protein